MVRVERLPIVGRIRAFDLIVISADTATVQSIAAFCRDLRASGGPALLVLAPDKPSDAAVDLLEAGADDCLRRPANPRELSARARALLRREAARRKSQGNRPVLLGKFELDAMGMRIRSFDGRTQALTVNECRLLRELAAHEGAVVSRAALLDAVFGEAHEPLDRTIDGMVARLRRRLRSIDADGLVQTYRGGGYYITPDPPIQSQG